MSEKKYKLKEEVKKYFTNSLSEEAHSLSFWTDGGLKIDSLEEVQETVVQIKIATFSVAIFQTIIQMIMKSS